MKRIGICCLVTLLLFGCKAEIKFYEESKSSFISHASYFRQSVLTDDEKEIIKMMTDAHVSVWEFQCDEEIQKIKLTLYQLNNEKAEWEIADISGLGYDPGNIHQGRMLIYPQGPGEKIRIAILESDEIIEDASIMHNITMNRDKTAIASSEAWSKSYCTNRIEYQQNQEILMYIEVFSSEGAMLTIDPSDFENPERLADWNYDTVYAMTIEFSTEPWK